MSNHTEEIIDIPFTLAGGQETVNAGFILFCIISASLFYTSITRNEPILKAINFFWFIVWTALFIKAEFNHIYIFTGLIMAILPMFFMIDNRR